MREDSSENMSLLANYRATRGEANDGYRSSSREPNCFTFNQSLQQPFSTSSYFSTGSSSISQPGSSLTSTPAATPSDCSPENQRNTCKPMLTNSCKPLPLTITIMLILSLVGVITFTKHHSSPSSSSIEHLHSVSSESLQGSPDLSSPINESLAVQTECGKYIGLTKDEGYIFKGIRYGVAPIGSLRWSSTQPIWVDSAYCDAKSQKRATKFGPSCFQINPYTKKYQGSEDCLFLNVWTPTLNDSPFTISE